jgi:ankyrin repeat protein
MRCTRHHTAVMLIVFPYPSKCYKINTANYLMDGFITSRCSFDDEYILLSAGIDVDCTEKNKMTPLFLAGMNGHLAVVELLLRNGASTKAQDIRLSFS